MGSSCFSCEVDVEVAVVVGGGESVVGVSVVGS